MTALTMNMGAVLAAAAAIGIVGEVQLAEFLGCRLDCTGIRLIAAVTTRLQMPFAEAFTVVYEDPEAVPWWAEPATVGAWTT